MEGHFWYPVYCGCPDLHPSHTRAVERYFRNHRKSGGGDSGPLRKDESGVYNIAFMNQKDQREVLRRENHEVDIGNTLLRFRVCEGQVFSPPSPQPSNTQQPTDRPKDRCGTTPKTFARSSVPPSGEHHELRLDFYLLRYLKDCPKAGRWLDEQLSLLHCTAKLCPEDERVLVRRCSQQDVGNWKSELGRLFETLKHHYLCHFETDPCKVNALLECSGFQTDDDDVKVYKEADMAVVVGKMAQVNARLNALQEKRIVLPFGEGKLRLMWGQLEHILHKDFPKVKATIGEEGQLVLEGGAADVLKAYDFTVEKKSMVVEKKLSNFNPGYLAFWMKAYGKPGMLSDYLGLDVEIEIQETELRVLSFSTASLDETELALQREFKLKEFPYTNSTMLCSLKEKVKPTLQKMNRNGCRVDVFASSGNIIYLVGHTKEVEELNEEVTELILESFEEEDQNQAQEFTRRQHSLTSHSFDLGDTYPPASVSSELDQQFSSLCVNEEAEVVARYCLSDELEVFVCLGDITKQEADALVNSANEDLKHSRGVALALSIAGGPEVRKESSDLVENIGKISTGDVVVTSGGQLKCKKLLHAVGPLNGKAGGRENIFIQKAITSALNLCEIMEFTSIALPCISSGELGVPIDVCAEAIVSAVRAFGAMGGRSLAKITLIDNRGEVVRRLRAQCDRLLQGEAVRDAEGARSPESPTGAAAGGSRSSVRVEITQGTIENQQEDAVVSPMFGGCPLSTRVGNCLREKVGQQLMDLYREQGEGWTPGDAVLVEGLTGAAFRAVFLPDLLPWDDDPDGTAVEVLRLAINNILTSCENQGFTSVAFPVLGAGALFRFPEEIVAQVLHEEICSFDQRRTSMTPFFVNIVCPLGHEMFEKTFSCIQESLKHPINQESEAKRIILLGKTGSGKSSLANSILGENVFEADDSPNSGTKRCQSKTKVMNGRNITLIDTPGLFDSERSEEELMPEILSCITECTPGPHAFLIVLKVEKFSEQEQAIITKICQLFSEEAFQYATVVFTHGNQLPEGTDIETFVQQSKHLKELVRKCGNRCHVVDNKYWNTDQSDPYRNNKLQVEALLKTIDEMVMDNNWAFYTNKTFKAMEKDIEIEEATIKENNDFMSREELRNEAKKRVSNRWLISLAGVGTGAVLGAAFGVEALVRLVITAVQNGTFMKGAQKFRSALGLTTTGDVALATAGVAVGVAAVGGGIAGGVIGGMASDEAESMQEAHDRAWKAVMAAREEGWNAFSERQ